MPFQASGQIAMNQVNYVLRNDGLVPTRGNTDECQMNEYWVRSLASKPTAASEIKLSDLYSTGVSTPP